MRKATLAALTAATLAVAGGYYAVADALDLVPGVLTLSSTSAQAAPFPSTLAQDATMPAAARLSDDAATPSATALAGYAATLAADPLVGGGSVGVSVIDVATGEVLLDHGASTPLTPASSNKVLTAWSALRAMGAGHRLTTSATLSGSTLTLVGGGDVLLAADAGNPDAVVGHAGLGDLARAAAKKLATQGVSSVHVALDDTLFTGPTWNSGWEDGNEAWVAPIQPIMIDVTAHEGTGSYPADPAMEAAQAFKAALQAAGITVEGDVTRAASPEGAEKIASVQSAPLEDVLSVSLKASDNSMTEVEGHVLAAYTGHEASFAGAVQAVEEQLKADGFDTTGLSLHDSSGLAKANKVPARLLAQIVARAAGKEGGTAGRTLIADLPVAGWDGTLAGRFNSGAATGRVRAKTGSLDQSASLTGVAVTADGRQVAFSVVIDGFAKGGLYSARVALDRDFVQPLAACGCAG